MDFRGFIANIDIKKGEEITVNYMGGIKDVYKSREMRGLDLMETWNFRYDSPQYSSGNEEDVKMKIKDVNCLALFTDADPEAFK